MSPKAQRIAIAEACGWDVDPHEAHGWGSRGQWCVCPGDVKRELVSKNMDLPQYLTDLNAMHEAEKVLVSWDDPRNVGHYVWKDSYGRYIGWLGSLTDSKYFHPKADSTEFKKLISATAAQRAEAFLRTLNLWDDSK